MTIKNTVQAVPGSTCANLAELLSIGELTRRLADMECALVYLLEQMAKTSSDSAKYQSALDREIRELARLNAERDRLIREAYL